MSYSFFEETLSVQITPKMKKALEEAARENETTISQFVRWTLKERLDKQN